MRATKPRPKKPLPRKVHVPGLHAAGDVWSYRITRGKVFVRNPTNDGTWEVFHDVFTGLDWDTLERLGWKNNGYRITPQDVKDFILNSCRPVAYKDNFYRFAVSRYKRPEKA